MTRRTFAALACAALLAAACGGATGDPTTTSSSPTTTSEEATATSTPGETTTTSETETTGVSGDVNAFCEAMIEAENTVMAGPAVDFDVATEDEVNAAMEAWGEQVATQLDEVEANLPEDISTEAQALISLIRQGVESGDEAFLQTEDFLAADRAVDQYLVENCELEAVDVAGVEYAFEGVPETVQPGLTAFSFGNQGSEVHEMVLFRIEDETATLEELLAMPEEEAQQLVSFLGVSFADPGEDGGVVFADLEPGRYAFVCFIPVGTTSLDQLPESEEEAGAPPHFTQGMAAEFTVEG